jgi:hypothetical protein
MFAAFYILHFVYGTSFSDLSKGKENILLLNNFFSRTFSTTFFFQKKEFHSHAFPFETRKFDIKWAAPNAEDSFTDARGNIIISYDCITVNSSSVAFDLNMQVQTSYVEDYLSHQDPDAVVRKVPLVIEGLDLDLRMRGFELASFFSMIQFDSPRPHHLKATGRVKFLGKVVKSLNTGFKHIKSDDNTASDVSRLAGEISLTGIKLNQLTLAPQSTGFLSVSRDSLMVCCTDLRSFGNFTIMSTSMCILSKLESLIHMKYQILTL